jgi:hypothetical protein
VPGEPGEHGTDLQVLGFGPVVTQRLASCTHPTGQQICANTVVFKPKPNIVTSITSRRYGMISPCRAVNVKVAEFEKVNHWTSVHPPNG